MDIERFHGRTIITDSELALSKQEKGGLGETKILYADLGDTRPSHMLLFLPKLPLTPIFVEENEMKVKLTCIFVLIVFIFNNYPILHVIKTF